jgi:hypothetical protein
MRQAATTKLINAVEIFVYNLKVYYRTILK